VGILNLIKEVTRTAAKNQMGSSLETLNNGPSIRLREKSKQGGRGGEFPSRKTRMIEKKNWEILS